MSHIVIIVPGLGDKTEPIKWATRHWNEYGLEPVVHSIGWRKGEKHFAPKLEKLFLLIDILTQEGNKVSLVGTSAGASAVLNAFLKRKSKIHKVVSVCGRLRKGEENGFRSFEKRSVSSVAFQESVLMFENNEQKLTKKDKKKIMTISAIFDELVPAEKSFIKGATNK